MSNFRAQTFSFFSFFQMRYKKKEMSNTKSYSLNSILFIILRDVQKVMQYAPCDFTSDENVLLGGNEGFG